MSQERSTPLQEEDLRSAVRALAESTSTTGPIVDDTSHLIAATSALPLSTLAYWERVIRSELEIARHAPLTAKPKGWRALLSLRRSKAEASPGRHLTWIDLISGDGRERESALRTLVGPAPNRFLFALAARRLNDWVPQVRAAARETIPRLALNSDAEYVADALCAMLPTWVAWGRIHVDDRQVLVKLLASPAVVASLARRVTDSTAGPMTTILSQALRTPALDAGLAHIAAKAVQPAVRAQAYRALLSGKAVWVESRAWKWTDVRYCRGRATTVLGERLLAVSSDLAETVWSAANDRSSLVRRVAAEALVREMDRLGDAVLHLARRLAQDPSAAVAERGAFVLQRLSEVR